MDGSAFSCCLQNKRTSGLSVWTAPEKCTDYPQLSVNLNPLKPSCNSCSRNFIKCKPWRRKTFLSITPKLTCFKMFSCLKLLYLLLVSLFNAVLHVLSRTISTAKTSRLRLHWVLLLASFLGGISFPLASCQESLQPTQSVKSQLPNAVVYVGSAFSYNISTSVFDCEVDSIVVSETADRFLSHWLSYNNKKKQLYGVPSDKDKGTYNILVVALTKDGAVRGHVCGSKSFSIVVIPVSDELPVSIYFGTGGSRSYHKSVHSLSCVPGTQAVLGTIVLNADIQGLNGHERMVLLLKMADHLNIHASKVSFFSGETYHPMTQHLDNPAVMAAGVGDGRFAKGSRSLLTWNIGCGAFKLEDAAFSRLETDAQDGTVSSLLGFPVVGWHVISGAQKNMARHRVRRNVGSIGNTPTPTTTSAPPTRMSNMSTLVITSRTVTLTSAVSVNSTIRLSTSATSSVTPNRTVVQSSGVSINSTVFSQSPTRTIQFSTLSVNLTVSSQSPNRTDIQSSTASINLTASSQSFSRTVILSSRIVNLSSSMTSFSPTSVLSSSILVSNSSTPMLSRNITQIINKTSSPVTTLSLNSTFITRTATTSISLSVPVISSLSIPTTTMAENSSSFVLSPNESATFILSSPTILSITTSQVISSFVFTTPLSNVTTLIPSTPQVNSTVVTRTSSFTVSSNRTILVASTSLLSSTTPVLTTLQLTLVTVSTSQLNSSQSNVTPVTLTRQPTPTVIISSSSMTIANTSIPVTMSVNQTSSSTRSKAFNLSSILSTRLTSTFSISPSSSLLVLFPNTTSVENVTSFVTSGLVRSSQTLFSSTLQLGSTTVLNRTSLIPTSTFSVLTISSTERSFATSRSLVPPSLNFSIVILSSSLIQRSTTLVSSSSSARVNMTSVVRNITSTTTQPNATSTSTVIMPSLTVSPLVTSMISTSVVITVNTTSSALPSSSALSSSNTTQTVTEIDRTQTFSVLPTSSVPPTTRPNQPPMLLNNIGRVRAPAGKALHYTIPDDTFYDREDQATTRNLTLSISLANGSSIPTDFWLQFDNASQTINGLPLNKHVPDGILGQVLVLHARDKNSSEAFDAFEVLVVPSEKPVVQELRIRITNEFAVFNRDLAQRLALLKKIAAYYGDADESKIRVLAFSPGSVIMTWTNDSLPTDRCDQKKLQYVENKVLLPNGEVREEFRDALEGFPVVSASEERFGVCNGSYIVPTEQPIDPAKQQSKMDEHLWYKHVLVGVLIVLMVIILSVLLIWCYRRRRPKPSSEKRTFKKRKPIVLEQEIELKPMPGNPLVLPDDDPSLPPSYISETSLDKPMYSDDEDEEDYGKRSPSVVYENPPPFYPTLDDDPRNSPPPAYLMPPMYY